LTNEKRGGKMPKNKKEMTTLISAEVSPEGVALGGDAVGDRMLFEVYCHLLGSVDWLRDPRVRPQTICRNCLRDAKIAIEIFNQERMK
jgi:hypothetical protein